MCSMSQPWRGLRAEGSQAILSLERLCLCQVYPHSGAATGHGSTGINVFMLNCIYIYTCLSQMWVYSIHHLSYLISLIGVSLPDQPDRNNERKVNFLKCHFRKARINNGDVRKEKKLFDAGQGKIQLK